MSAVAVPSDRRFRRAHVKPGRKRRGWRAAVAPAARIAALALVVGFGFYRLAALVAEARILRVERIVVSGNERLSDGEVLAVLTGLRGESLIRTDLTAWRHRLLASPWVREAALRRSLPSTVEVAIAEREPIGIGRLSGAMYLVDEEGVVIDQYGPQYAEFDLPIIDGLSPAPPGGDPSADADRADLAARVIAAVRPEPAIARRLSQIDVTDLHDAIVILAGDPAVLHLGRERFLPRLQGYVELAAALRERVPDIDYVDLRFDERIYVRPARTSPRSRAATSIQVFAKPEQR